MACLLHHWLLAVTHHQFGFCAIEFQCDSLCHSIFFGADTEHRWKLFPLYSIRPSQRYDEKTQNNSFSGLHPLNHSDYRDRRGNSDTRVGLFIFGHTGLSVLLVHYQFYTIWSENTEEIM